MKYRNSYQELGCILARWHSDKLSNNSDVQSKNVKIWLKRFTRSSSSTIQWKCKVASQEFWMFVSHSFRYCNRKNSRLLLRMCLTDWNISFPLWFHGSSAKIKLISVLILCPSYSLPTSICNLASLLVMSLKYFLLYAWFWLSLIYPRLINLSMHGTLSCTRNEEES